MKFVIHMNGKWSPTVRLATTMDEKVSEDNVVVEMSQEQAEGLLETLQALLLGLRVQKVNEWGR